MSVKLNFKLDRRKLAHTGGGNINVSIKTELEKCFTEKGLTFSRIYVPSHKFIKVLLASEDLVERVFSNCEHFKSKGFDPCLTMQLRTARTVFCYGFDTSLLDACDSETIKTELIQANWGVSNVYILQSKRSMKIEFKSRATANEFLKVNSINVGGIRIDNHQMEPEVDPSINQCYNCGIINPGHTRDLCPHPQCCMRCGYQGHPFYQCPTIPNISPSEYLEHHKNEAYCIPCRAANGHCSLNHRVCPIKKQIISKRIMENRSNRAKIQGEKAKESELSKQIAIELTKMNEWPKPQSQSRLPEPSLAMSAIITLAMVEEACHQGTFQANLDKACDDNNFPKFKYDISHDAAVMVVQKLSANPGPLESIPKHASKTKTAKHLVNYRSNSQPAPVRSTSLRSVTDARKHLGAIQTDLESDSYYSDSSNRPKRARVSPNKTTNIGALNDIQERLEEYTYIINTELDRNIGAGIEEISVLDLLTLYEASNSELSDTRRAIITALLKQAVDMNRDMSIKANIIRVGEDFH